MRSDLVRVNSKFKMGFWTLVIVSVLLQDGVSGLSSIRGYNEPCVLRTELDRQAINVLDSRYASILHGVTAGVLEGTQWTEAMNEDYVSELFAMHGLCDPNQLLDCFSILNEDSPEGTKHETSGAPPPISNVLGVPDPADREYILTCRCNPVFSVHTVKSGVHQCLAFHGHPCEYKAAGQDLDGTKQYKLKADYNCVEQSVCEPISGLDKGLSFGEAISATSGVPLRSSGLRRPIVRLMEQYTIRICLCDDSKGYKHDTKGLCVNTKNDAKQVIDRSASFVRISISIFSSLVYSIVLS